MDVLNARSGAGRAVDETAGGDGDRIMRNVSLRILPFLLGAYIVSFLDRGNVSFAVLQMGSDLHLTPAVYGLGAGLFFITYCVFELPSNLMLYRFGATRWIARIMLTWGLCAAAMALVTGPVSFYCLRLLLGMAEAGFFPGVLFFLTLWYPTAYRGRVLGIFMAGAALSGVIGAPISGFMLSLDGAFGLRGWQWLFILEGLPAIILAPLCLIYLQESPAKAHWLPEADRSWLIRTLAAERRDREAVQKHSVWDALTDRRVLFLAAMYFTNVCLLNGILFFLPLILKGFGLTNIQTGLVAALPSLAAVVAVILWGRHSDRKQERYGHAALANCVGGVALLASVLLVDPTARIAAVIVAMAATLAFTPAFWAIPPTFLSGAASAGGYAAISSLGVLGGFVAPSVIGYLANVSGDFRVGLGIDGALAIAMSAAFYLVGRREVARLRLALGPAGLAPGH